MRGDRRWEGQKMRGDRRWEGRIIQTNGNGKRPHYYTLTHYHTLPPTTHYHPHHPHYHTTHTTTLHTTTLHTTTQVQVHETNKQMNEAHELCLSTCMPIYLHKCYIQVLHTIRARILHCLPLFVWKNYSAQNYAQNYPTFPDVFILNYHYTYAST